MALIRCKLKRAGGTKIDNLFGKNYHFRPAADDKSETPDHVCQVEDAAAIHRLLRIKEGYELVDPTEELPPAPAAAPKGQTITADKAPVEAKPIIVSDGETEYNLVEMTLEELRTLANEGFGVKPHHKWTKDTIIAKIIEKTREE